MRCKFFWHMQPMGLDSWEEKLNILLRIQGSRFKSVARGKTKVKQQVKRQCYWQIFCIVLGKKKGQHLKKCGFPDMPRGWQQIKSGSRILGRTLVPWEGWITCSICPKRACLPSTFNLLFIQKPE